MKQDRLNAVTTVLVDNPEGLYAHEISTRTRLKGRRLDNVLRDLMVEGAVETVHGDDLDLSIYRMTGE